MGGYAVIAHGCPRATGDIDIWVRPSPGNAERVLIFQIGVVPNRIDILTAIDGVTFDEAWTTRITTRVEGQDVSALGREALLRNKKASGRKKDLLDASWLEEPDDPS